MKVLKRVIIELLKFVTLCLWHNIMIKINLLNKWMQLMSSVEIREFIQVSMNSIEIMIIGRFRVWIFEVHIVIRTHNGSNRVLVLFSPRRIVLDSNTCGVGSNEKAVVSRTGGFSADELQKRYCRTARCSGLAHNGV